MGLVNINTNTLGAVVTSGFLRPPFFSDLDTWHKTITGVDFAESINNLPAKFLPRVGNSDGLTEKLTWTTPISNDLTIWSVAFRFNEYTGFAGANNFTVGGSGTKSVMLKRSGFFGFRDSGGVYMIWNGSGNTISVTSASLQTGYNSIILRSDATNIYLYVNGVNKGYITPTTGQLFFDKFILGFSSDANGADGNFWDLRFWNSDVGDTEAMKYHLDTITINPTNWFPDVYSGYDVVGSNHATSNLDYDYENQGSTYLNDNGYSLWQLAANPDIQVPFDINGLPLILTAGVNIPAGYTKTRDIQAGNTKWNMADALIDFDPDVGTAAAVDMFDRSNATIQNATSRASLFYDAGFPYRYQVNEIADPRIYESFFEAAYQYRIFSKIILATNDDLIRYDEELNYGTQKTTAEVLRINKYLKNYLMTIPEELPAQL